MKEVLPLPTSFGNYMGSFRGKRRGRISIWLYPRTSKIHVEIARPKNLVLEKNKKQRWNRTCFLQYKKIDCNDNVLPFWSSYGRTYYDT